MAGELKAEISREFVTSVAENLADECAAFDLDKFLLTTFDSSWKDLELKDRIRRVPSALGASFAGDYPKSIEVLKRVSVGYSGLQALMFPEFVEQFGLEYWDESMDALTYFTSLCSSEFAVRPFIRLDQPRMMDQMLLWAHNNDHHIRRLASEGCRPRLPWASPLRRFIADPEPVLPILNELKNDSEEYVRRSVANNLNDISKDHSDLALELGQQWIDISTNTNWVVKHGLRTLLKRGNTDALMLFGYASPDNIRINSVSLSNGSVRIGESGSVQFELLLKGNKSEKVRLEYAIDYLKANGKLSRKVFQAGERLFESGAHFVSKKQAFRQMTTRKHYPGKHHLNIVVNGRVLASAEFDLLPE